MELAGGVDNLRKQADMTECIHCDQPVTCARLCEFHYRATLWDRVLSNSVADEAGCWIWKLILDKDGYGWANAYRGHVRAHRLAYELAVGPIANGLTIDHLCRVRNCVNPEHLEPVTHLENMRRMRGPRGRNGEGKRELPTHCGHGHELNTENVYTSPRGDWQCKPCRRRVDTARQRRRKAERALQA